MALKYNPSGPILSCIIALASIIVVGSLSGSLCVELLKATVFVLTAVNKLLLICIELLVKFLVFLVLVPAV